MHRTATAFQNLRYTQCNFASEFHHWRKFITQKSLERHYLLKKKKKKKKSCFLSLIPNSPKTVGWHQLLMTWETQYFFTYVVVLPKTFKHTLMCKM